MNSPEQEAGYLEVATQDLREKGYEIYTHFSHGILPSELEGYQPDAVAIGPSKNFIIEIQRDGKTLKNRDLLNKFLEEHTNWEVRVIYIRSSGQKALTVELDKTIVEEILRMQDLIEQSHYAPALLVGWAVLESWARREMVGTFDRPQTPARVVSKLAGSGILVPDDADFMLTMAEKRNKYIHGQLSTEVTRADIKRFLRIIKARFAKRIKF